MLITTGKVNDGVIQVEAKDFPDGTTVTVLAHEGDETFELDAAQEADTLLRPSRKANEASLSTHQRFFSRFAPHEPSASDSHCQQCGSSYRGSSGLVGIEQTQSARRLRNKP